jgi:hypothetical protein
VVTGAGGSGVGGSFGTGGTGGSGTGGDVADAAGGSAAMDASSAVDVGVDTGTSYPEASTCAGYAVSFNGFSYGSVTRPVQDDFTLEAWINTTDARTGMSNFYEGSGLIYADVSGMANDFGSSVLNGKFAFGVGNPDTTLLSTTTVNTGQWVHVAATRKMSTGEIQLFVNGTMEASMTVAAQTSSLNANANMTIGANTVDGRYFTGQIDEVRIWSVVRSAADISANMGKRMQGNEAGLAAYYRFDEPGVDVTPDLSSRKMDLSLVGPPDWVASTAPICN